MFWNAEDLARKLSQYQDYYNETRVHSSLSKKTPNQKAANDDISNEEIPLENIPGNLTVVDCLIYQLQLKNSNSHRTGLVMAGV